MIRISFDNGPTMSLAPCLPETPAVETESSAFSFSLLRAATRDARKNIILDDDTDSVSQSFRLRKSQKVSCVLRMFSRLVKGSLRLPKLENIRYRVMRSLKKSIRRTLSRREIASKGLLKVEKELLHSLLTQFRTYCETHRTQLETFSSLQNGPCVDHRGSGVASSHNTYNNDYMRKVLAIPEVQTAYRLFARLLFPGDAPRSMCRRFHIFCCQEKEHVPECEEKWQAFEGLVRDFLGAEVDLIDTDLPV